MTPNDQFSDFALISLIDLHRVGAGLLVQIQKDLAALERDIVAEVVNVDPTGTPREASRQKRLRELLASIKAKIEEVRKELTDRLESDFQDIADKQEEKERKAFTAIFGIDLDESKIDAAAIVIFGATLSGWLQAQADDLTKRIGRVLTEGVDSGMSGPDLAEIVKGEGKAAVEQPIDTAMRQAGTVIQTGMDTIANEITLGLGDGAPKTIRIGWQQISVLDSRTTVICRQYAFRIWDRDFKPIGHKLPFNGGPPRHPNCRSRVIMITLDDDAAGVEKQSFREWLNSKSAADLERLFGKARVQLWKDGKIADSELIRGATPMSLDEFLAS